MSLHPTRRRSSTAKQGLDDILGRETRERHHLGYDTARAIGVEPSTGIITYYARFDNAQVLKLCARAEAPLEDLRVRDLVDYIKAEQGQYGLWTYNKPQATKWVTYDMLSSLPDLLPESDWEATQPRTPFQSYPLKRKRF